MDWEPAERVQKNSAGEYRAMIGGEWVPVAKAQKNSAGAFRVMRSNNVNPLEGNFSRNKVWAKPSDSYQTRLDSADESGFREWLKMNKNRVGYFNPDNSKEDYDMRGWWLANKGALAPDGHFPDTYKTPYHKTFSNESMYANSDAPKWVKQGDTWNLTANNGSILYSEPNTSPTTEQPQAADNLKDNLKNEVEARNNFFPGLVRGAGSIGATIMWPYDKLMDYGKGDRYGGQESRNEERRRKMDEALKSLGADPESGYYQGGKLSGEIAGTAGMGPALAGGAKMLPVLKNAPKFVEGLRTGGFRLGGAPAANVGEAAGNAIQRVATGGIVGGTAAGTIDPKYAETGAGIGAVLPGAAKFAGRLGSLAKASLYDPLFNRSQIMGNALMRAVGREEAPNVIQSLSNKAQTPGVRFSAGEASGNESLAAMEDALRSANAGGALSKAAQENRTVLANQLRNIGQDDAAIQAATEARSAAASPLYEQAPAELAAAEITPEISAKMAELTTRPAIQTALKRAEILARNKGAAGSAEMGGATLENLHNAKTALDDMISQATRSGKNETVKALMQAKTDLLGVLEDVAPSYREGARVFAEKSQPINQMEVGQYLSNKLIPATAGDAPTSLNAAMLARALKNPDASARVATGFPGAKFEGIMSPEQTRAISGVNSDASVIAETLRRGAGYGSPTARRLATGGYIGENFAEKAPLLSKLFEGIGQIPGVNIATKGVSTIGGMVGKGINNKIAMRLDEMLATDPEGVGAMLQQELANLSQAERDAVMNILPKGALTAVAGAMGAQ